MGLCPDRSELKNRSANRNIGIQSSAVLPERGPKSLGTVDSLNSFLEVDAQNFSGHLYVYNYPPQNITPNMFNPRDTRKKVVSN